MLLISLYTFIEYQLFYYSLVYHYINSNVLFTYLYPQLLIDNLGLSLGYYLGL